MFTFTGSHAPLQIRSPPGLLLQRARMMRMTSPRFATRSICSSGCVRIVHFSTKSNLNARHATIERRAASGKTASSWACLRTRSAPPSSNASALTSCKLSGARSSFVGVPDGDADEKRSSNASALTSCKLSGARSSVVRAARRLTTPSEPRLRLHEEQQL